MTKRIFPSFPQGPPHVPCVDAALNAIVDVYGGWSHVLDPSAALETSLLDDLAKAGYLADELVVWRLVHGSRGRDRVVLLSACLGCIAALQDDDLSFQMSAGYFFNFDQERKAHNVSYAEIALAAEKVSPYIQRQMSASSS